MFRERSDLVRQAENFRRACAETLIRGMSGYGMDDRSWRIVLKNSAVEARRRSLIHSELDVVSRQRPSACLPAARRFGRLAMMARASVFMEG
jgi:hypothetical protein